MGVFSLNAQDLTSLYKSGNYQEVFNQLEKNLVSREYWEQKLADGNYSLGYYEQDKTVLFACKDCQSLRHFRVSNSNVLELNHFDANFGKEKGDKFIEGDLKTPLGVYDFRQKIQGKNLDQYYGPVAFVTNYPNTFDRSLSKNGYGIWLHGLPLNGDREDLSTKGCVVLENDDLSILKDKINHKNSILITAEQEDIFATKAEITQILVSLFQWRKAWLAGDIESYIRFYSPDFKTTNKQNYKAFKKRKAAIFSRNKNISIFVSNLEITPYPNSLNKRIFKIKFFEDYQSNIHSYHGFKELFIQLSDEYFTVLVEN